MCSDSLGKLFAAYLRRAEESVLGSVLVETTVLYMSTRHNPAQVIQEAAAAYKVNTEAIALKVKQEFAAKEKARTEKKLPTKTAGKVKKQPSPTRYTLGPAIVGPFFVPASHPDSCSCTQERPFSPTRRARRSAWGVESITRDRR
jgi:hypothetical protein